MRHAKFWREQIVCSLHGYFSDKGRKLNNIRISGGIMIDNNIEFPARIEIEALDVRAC